MRKNILWRGALCALALTGVLTGALTGCGRGGAASSESGAGALTLLTIGTADSGGTMYQAGSAIAQVITQEDSSIKINISASSGSNQNVRLLDSGEVDLALIDGAKVFHFGTLSLTDEPARAATQKAVAYAKEKGRLISFDPNLRKPLWPGETAAKEQIEWGLHQADIVKISDEEIAFLWGLSPEEGAQKLLKEYGVQLVYATLGPRGCRFANRQGSGEVASPAGIHVVDTTGAGDIFGGSAMSQFLKTGKAPADLTVEEMRAITRFACCAASLSTQTHGGIDSVPEERLVHNMLRTQFPFEPM